jgi:hypothetical protein
VPLEEKRRKKEETRPINPKAPSKNMAKPWFSNRQLPVGSRMALSHVSDGMKTDSTCRFENHLPQRLDGSSIQHWIVGCRSES